MSGMSINFDDKKINRSSFCKNKNFKYYKLQILQIFSG